jgi:hypothetical protein
MSDEGRVMPAEAVLDTVPVGGNAICRAKGLSVSSGHQGGTTSGRRAGCESGLTGCRAGDITISSRGVRRRVL